MAGPSQTTDLAVYCVVTLPEGATLEANETTLQQLKAVALAHPVVSAIDGVARYDSDKIAFVRSNADASAFIADFVVRAAQRAGLVDFLDQMVPPEGLTPETQMQQALQATVQQVAAIDGAPADIASATVTLIGYGEPGARGSAARQARAWLAERREDWP